MRRIGREPRLPDAPLPYLLEYLFEVGPAQGGGFGPAPLSHAELLAWQTNMRRTLQPWEISMLRRLSMAWIAEQSQAQDRDAPPPWAGEEVSAEERASVSDSLRDSIRALAARGAK